MKTNVLIVFRHEEARAFVTHALADDYAVASVNSGSDALERVRSGDFSVVVANDTLGDMTGEELATKARAIRPGTRVVITSTRDNIENAISVLGPGQFVYVEKPLSAPRLAHAVAVELDRATLYAENWKLRARVDGVDPMGLLIGSSMAIDHIRERVRYIGAARANVLITGANGTGKQLAAEAVHRSSARATGPLVRVDCATSTEETLERELFGFHHADAVGRRRRERGKLEAADGGTLLVLEVGELSPGLQGRLMEALRDNGNDTRVIATTRRDLKEQSRAGAFREDLYYAINVLTIEMPTLRERRADIGALAAYFAAYFAARSGIAPVEFTPAAIERLGGAPWRGNVRELQNVIEHAVLTSGGGVVDADDLNMTVSGGSGPGIDEVERVFRFGAVREMERLMILNRLREKNDNRTRSAESLDISVRTLRNKLNEYNVTRGEVLEDDAVLV